MTEAPCKIEGCVLISRLEPGFTPSRSHNISCLKLEAAIFVFEGFCLCCLHAPFKNNTRVNQASFQQPPLPLEQPLGHQSFFAEGPCHAMFPFVIPVACVGRR